MQLFDLISTIDEDPMIAVAWDRDLSDKLNNLSASPALLYVKSEPDSSVIKLRLYSTATKYHNILLNVNQQIAWFDFIQKKWESSNIHFFIA